LVLLSDLCLSAGGDGNLYHDESLPSPSLGLLRPASPLSLHEVGYRSPEWWREHKRRRPRSYRPSYPRWYQGWPSSVATQGHLADFPPSSFRWEHELFEHRRPTPSPLSGQQQRSDNRPHWEVLAGYSMGDRISMPEIGYRSPEWWREHRHRRHRPSLPVFWRPFGNWNDSRHHHHSHHHHHNQNDHHAWGHGHRWAAAPVVPRIPDHDVTHEPPIGWSGDHVPEHAQLR